MANAEQLLSARKTLKLGAGEELDYTFHISVKLST